MIEHEPTVSTAEACRILNVGHNFMTKMKREMGIEYSRKVFVSEIAKHIRKRRSQLPPDHRGAGVGTNGEPSSRRALKTA